MKPIAVLSLIVLFCQLGCSGETKLPTADPEKLIGTWEIDYESTWNLSRDAFMNDTMRGADAYPDDVKEKATLVKGEMEKLFGDGVCTFGEEGAVSMTLEGRTQEGSYEVKSQEGNTLEIGLENLLRAKGYAVEFLAEDTSVLVLKNKLPIRIVLHRKGGEDRASPEQLEVEEADGDWYEKLQKKADEASAEAKDEEERRRVLENARDQESLMDSLATALKDYHEENEGSFPDSLLDLKRGDRPPKFMHFRGSDSFENFVGRLDYVAKNHPKSDVLVATEIGANGKRLVILRDFWIESITEETYLEAIKK